MKRMRPIIASMAFVVSVIITVGEDESPAETRQTIPLGDTELELAWIPSGSFMMGSSNDGERPVRRITITQGFWMGIYPVTQQVWEEVLGAHTNHCRGVSNPVDSVSWMQCQEFIAALNARVEGGGFRLPTEAEWEYACRAGSTNNYPIGAGESILASTAWYNGNSGRMSQAIGLKAPNAWGLYDMQGNIWEWCSDWYDFYSAGDQTDPTGPAQGTDRIIRGGSVYDPPDRCTATAREFCNPTSSDFNLGLRLVRVK